MSKYDVAAFIWPSYTGDELRSRMFWPEGFGEWETVKCCKPKFEGHNWPRKPLWGYVNEADPDVMEMEINAASRHGVNVFIYDWYWYDKRPFLECCLNDGFLKAANNKDMKFYLMWANHDATHLWDRRHSDKEPRNTVIWKGSVNRVDFEEMAIRLVDKYFGYDNYYRIDDKPVFMIYDLPNFIAGFKDINEAEEALKWFRKLVLEKGYPGVHIQFCIRNSDKTLNLSGVDGATVSSYKDSLKILGADSFSHYNYCQVTDVNRDYNEMMADIVKEWKDIDNTFDIPYFPHITCGWDNNPRYPDELRPKILKNNTPENVENAMRLARGYIDSHSLPAPLITVNSWNEWTESSYLIPDDLYGYGYLDAAKKVFVDGN